MSTHSGLTARLTRVWVGQVVRFAPLVLMAALAAVAALGWYAANHLGINTSTADMIAERLPWRQAFIEYREAFPQLDHNLIVVIDAPDADHADAARDFIGATLNQRADLFAEVFAPGSDPFFRRHALLYLDTDSLQALSDRLAEAQPFLARLAADPTLAGLFALLETALGADVADRTVDVSPLLERIAGVARSFNAGQPDALSWQAVMAGSVEASARRVIVLKPRLDFAQAQPAREAIGAVRAAAAQLPLHLVEPVSVRLTGPVALEYEELSSVSRGVARSGFLALVMVLVILAFALRSVSLVVASLLTLIAGLIATAAFAALAVGALNLISVAFAVLYIGLGIDFAIHYCLRVREAMAHGAVRDEALVTSAGDVGASLVICAVTTSVGFFAFFPTTFRGVSELGLISGFGMYISLFMTLTLLPALMRVLPISNAPARADPKPLPRLVGHRALWPVTAVIALTSLAALPFVRFDSDPLNLRASGAESVGAFRDLMNDPNFAPRALSLVTASARIDALRQRLRSLDEVASVRGLDDFVPADQPAKLELIDELSWLIGPDLVVSGNVDRSVERNRAAVRALQATLAANGDVRGARALAVALDELGVADAVLQEFERALVGTMPARVDALRDALDAQAVNPHDLPVELRARWLTADGRERLEIVPAPGLTSNDAQARFVDAVRAADASATGLAVVQIEAGRAVVSSFRQAFLTALVVIALILGFLLRSWRATAIVLLPLSLAGLITTAVMTALGMPFNFANVIALPLLLGVGVDNGVHMVMRARDLRAAPGVAQRPDLQPRPDPSGSGVSPRSDSQGPAGSGISPVSASAAEIASSLRSSQRQQAGSGSGVSPRSDSQGPGESGVPPHGAAADLLGSSTARAVVYSALTTIASFGNLAFSGHPGSASMGQVLTIGMIATTVCTLILIPALLERATP